MTPRELIDRAEADGVRLVLSPGGRLRVLGGQEEVDRWLPIVAQYQRELVAELVAGGEIGAPVNFKRAGSASASSAHHKRNLEVVA